LRCFELGNGAMNGDDGDEQHDSKQLNNMRRDKATVLEDLSAS